MDPHDALHFFFFFVFEEEHAAAAGIEDGVGFVVFAVGRWGDIAVGGAANTCFVDAIYPRTGS